MVSKIRYCCFVVAIETTELDYFMVSSFSRLRLYSLRCKSQVLYYSLVEAEVEAEAEVEVKLSETNFIASASISG